MATPPLRLHYENPAGRLSEYSENRLDGHLEVAYLPGPRRFSDLQTLLGYTKQLLAQRGWHKILGDQRFMEPFTAEEEHWVTSHWLNVSHAGPRALFGAVILPAEVFAQLTTEVATAPGQVSAMTYRLFAELAPARHWLTQLP